MNPKIYIVPIISLIILYMIAFRPQITGFITGEPKVSGISEILANVTVMIREDGFIPENAKVVVYLDDIKAEMSFKEFVKKSGSEYDLVYSYIPEYNYEGNGYTGPYVYSLPLSEFSLDTFVSAGEHTLIVKVVFNDKILSQTVSKINI
ncbi:MAG: hypothetical protein QW051_02515 [Candidatus Aenigmatarchaeota archaeon]